MGMTRRINAHTAFAVFLLVLATVYASQIPELGQPFANATEPGAPFLPIVLAAVLYLSAARVLVQEFRKSSKKTDEKAVPGSDHIPAIGITGPILVAVFTGLFAAGLQQVGYFVAAGLYTLALALYFNFEESGRPVRSIAVALITAGAITVFGWLFFVVLFDLSLPTWSL